MNPNQSQAHMLVATALVATFVTIAVAQDWWLELRYYIESRASKNPPSTKPNNPNVPDTAHVIKWLLGMSALWIGLTFLVDLGETEELAEAIALVTMASVLMAYGPQALANLGFLSDAQASATKAGSTIQQWQGLLGSGGGQNTTGRSSGTQIGN